jgi:hypothetical protein
MQRNVVLGLLLALAAAAWVLLVWQGAGSSTDMAMASPIMGTALHCERGENAGG